MRGVLDGPSLLAVASGLVLGLGLIVAIGAQNAFVLRQGLRLEHVTAVVVVCTLSDFGLIAAGVLGAGAVVSRARWLTVVVCLAGAAFLVSYATAAARRALRPGTLTAAAGGPARSVTATVGACLALTWLNPHVYLDTLVLLGSTASGYGTHRWQFALGAGLASALWFSCLGYGARLLRPVFTRPASWRVFDTGIAGIMAVLAVSLAVRGLRS